MRMVDIYGGEFPNDIFFGIYDAKMIAVSFAPEIRFREMGGCGFGNCSIPKGDFKKLSLKYCVFSSCKMQGAMFHDATIEMGGFNDCNLQRSIMNRSSFNNCSFSDCDFSETDFLKASFKSCSFANCKFTGAFMREAHLSVCSFDEISLNNLKDSKASNSNKMNYTVKNCTDEAWFVVSNHIFE